MRKVRAATFESLGTQCHGRVPFIFMGSCETPFKRMAVNNIRYSLPNYFLKPLPNVSKQPSEIGFASGCKVLQRLSLLL